MDNLYGNTRAVMPIIIIIIVIITVYLMVTMIIMHIIIMTSYHVCTIINGPNYEGGNVFFCYDVNNYWVVSKLLQTVLVSSNLHEANTQRSSCICNVFICR